MPNDARPACLHCKHYYVTWDPEKPRGCRAFGFKTSEVPAHVVRRESGHDCNLYERKTTPRKPTPPGR